MIAPPAIALQAGVPVVCEASSPVVSSFDTVSRVIYLRDDVCARLTLLADGGRPRTARVQVELAYAVVAVGLEEAWATGSVQPAADGGAGFVAAQHAATCYGIRVAPLVLRALDVAAGYARTLLGWADYIQACG